MKTSTVIAGSALAALLGGLAVLAGCAKQGADAPAAPPSAAAKLPGGLQPQASILDLMLDFVDPVANELWGATPVVTPEPGSKDKPTTEEEWNVLRRKALTLAETANLLVIEGRPLAHPGQKLKDPPGEGDFTPEQAQAAIDKDRASFVTFALAMQGASNDLLKAIGKRDPDKILEAGGTLDEVCEGCHRKFWYPNAPVPPGA